MDDSSDELEKVIQETTESIGEICFSAIFISLVVCLVPHVPRGLFACPYGGCSQSSSRGGVRL
jgi:hypothetical protein